MRLARLRYGVPGDRPPVLIAHGLFGSARNWGVISKRLGESREVIAVDMRNHGESPHDPVHDYPAMADDLAEAIGELGRPAAVLGHSMGGKAAMCLALAHPSLVERLVVADIAPVTYRHDQLGNIRAMRGLDLAGITRRSEADARLAATVPEASLRAFFLQSLEIGAEGAAWKLNLAALEEQMPRILGFPEVTGRYPGPTLFLSGELSGYVRAENWPAIRALFPAAVGQTIPGAGHWLHAEATRPFLEAVTAFLDG